MDADERLLSALRAFPLSNRTSATTELAAAAEAHPALAPVLGKRLMNMLSSTQIQPHVFPDQMLELVRKGSTYEHALAQVVDFATTAKTELLSIQCIHGVHLERTVRLSDRLAIAPADELPQSHGDHFFVLANGSMPGAMNLFGPPRARAALVHRTDFTPAIRDEFPDLEEADWSMSQYNEVTDAIGRAFIALVISGAPVELGYRFSHATHPGYPGGGGGVFWTSAPNNHFRAQSIDVSKVVDGFNHLESFDGISELARLATRLSRARTHRDPVDAHLDFGIVAESLLTHSEKEQGEIRFRLSTRAGWLLGSSPADRAQVARRMKRLYDLRSTAAHEGRLPTTGSNAWTIADREDSDLLCTQLMQHVLHRGKFPTGWQEIMFGG